jgi:hypothetical protein
MTSPMSNLTASMRRVLAPLGAREERAAIRSAVEHFRNTQQRTGELRYRVLGAELRIEKPQLRESVPPRLVDVLIVDYGGKQILRLTVDRNKEIVESEALTFHPAFHRDELKEARRIAERAETFPRTVRGRRFLVMTFVPEGPPGHRRVGLHYLLRGDDAVPTPVAIAIVDLSEASLVSVEEVSHGRVR